MIVRLTYRPNDALIVVSTDRVIQLLAVDRSLIDRLTHRSMYPEATLREQQHLYAWLRQQQGGERIYHGWAGYSQDVYTIGGVHHAVDWLWQAPQYIMSGKYNWYVLIDINEPENWYQARTMVTKGVRMMDDRFEDRVEDLLYDVIPTTILGTGFHSRR